MDDILHVNNVEQTSNLRGETSLKWFRRSLFLVWAGVSDGICVQIMTKMEVAIELLEDSLVTFMSFCLDDCLM